MVRIRRGRDQAEKKKSDTLERGGARQFRATLIFPGNWDQTKTKQGLPTAKYMARGKKGTLGGPSEPRIRRERDHSHYPRGKISGPAAVAP